jgi:penicillin-binding protein 1C
MKSLRTFLAARKFNLPIWASVLLCGLLALIVFRLAPKPPLSEGYASSIAVYDAHRKLLRLTLSADEKFRLWVPLKEISPQLVDATLLHEDRYFYWHPGVNPVALLRGGYQTYVGGNRRQGASTLTMQLARMRYHIQSKTIGGKLEQILRAAALELRYSKRDILEAYLNLAPYGGNIEGVAAASLIYFNKPVAQLGLPEALALAVIPQSPHRRAMQAGSQSPIWLARQVLFSKWLRQHPEAAQQRELMALPLHLQDARGLPFHAPHFVDAVIAAQPAGVNVVTTLDLKLQRLLERQIRDYLKRAQRVGIKNASALLVDTRNMGVVASVGSANFFDDTISGQVNGTQAKRSPGSALKPFVYALAIDQGILHPMSILKDAPTSFGPFSPENFDGQFLGPITAQDALIRSRNVPAVAISAKLSKPSLYDFLRAANISELKSEKHYGLALVLGGGEVSMEELASLYAMLANGGVLKPLRYLANDAEAKGPRLISEAASFITRDMLKHNPRPDNPFHTSLHDLPIYWKTGTSWGFRDAWTAGGFGPYVLIVWLGNFDGESNQQLIGVQAAAPLFFQIADAINAERPNLKEPHPQTPPDIQQVEVCAASGDLPNPACPTKTKTWFIPGKSPIKVSTLHRPVMIDNRTGLRACAPFDSQTAHTEIYEYWPSDMQRLFIMAGLPRRAVPAAAPGCKTTEDASNGIAPRITSPLRAVTYTLETESIMLQATLDGDAQEVFWFANNGYIGSARRGQVVSWQPKKPGHFLLRAVDELGRADSRDIEIDVSK